MSGHADDQSGSGDAIAAWIPPAYNVEQPPTQIKSRGLLEDESFPGNFARSAKWSVGISSERNHRMIDPKRVPFQVSGWFCCVNALRKPVVSDLDPVREIPSISQCLYVYRG